MAPPNITGFDPKKLAAASGSPANDPWKRLEAWRYSGPFSRAARFKGTFPGFGIGLGAFAIYWAVDTFVLPKEDHHGEEHH
ncbi:putative nadh-ubiquinone oxidoreductase b12 subunit protein [Venturia nashicola]|uniref:Putative nadh-ubiquinone oxidoreductase b12 subunit protein n=1 Tax=Venturia nashicola TaxID=86259 RepID=A0A4Z1P0U2_9PEZI|nr:putative nadh-ubiquinone oxidoreductase b12 subunit protein [Venturia nashicola]TLD30190.1 putative nadh-ubiquinone oxidoreductase b12 subunit protein [Venturia nashicola]